MSKDLKVQCDCGGVFAPTSKMLLEHTQENGLTEVYYLCPMCRKKHHVLWHNSETKRLQKMIRTAKNKGQSEKALELIKTLKEKLDKLNKK